MKLSKNNKSLIKAYLKGYKITNDGGVLNKNGNCLKKQIKISKVSYKKYYFKIRAYKNESYPIDVHKLQAFQKFGFKIFKKGIEVRHLNNNSLDNSWDNIDIGTKSQNYMDLPKEVRTERARNNIKYDWSIIDKDRENGMSYNKLSEKYGVTKSTLSYRYSKI